MMTRVNNRLRNLIGTLLICVIALGAPVAYGVDVKIGYVDTALVLKEAPQAEIARKKLKDEFNPRDEKIVGMQNQLKTMTEQQEKDDKVMSAATRRDLERDILTLKRDIKRAKEEFTEDFNLRRNEELTKLQQIIHKTTIAVAKDKDFDVILTDSVLYASKRIDITDLILERLRNTARDAEPTGKTK
jgi:outer membrane protein